MSRLHNFGELIIHSTIYNIAVGLTQVYVVITGCLITECLFIDSLK